MVSLAEIVSTLKRMAPLSLAESWDNVGLLIEPDVKKSIACVLLTNDLTEDVLEEAQDVKANLIISYHPPLFKPFKRITSANWKVRETFSSSLYLLEILNMAWNTTHPYSFVKHRVER